MPFSRLVFIAASLFSCAAYADTPAPTTTAPSPAAAPAASQPVTRAELPALIKETLMNDPDIIMQAVAKLHEKQEQEEQKKAEAALSSHKDAMYNDPDSPIAGNPAGDVTVVEFFDYHCGYCKHLLPAIAKLIDEDKKVRVIFKEYPILSEDSVTASRAALAVNRIDKAKYFEYHTALMKSSGKFDEESLLGIAKKLGIDTEKLKAEIGKPEITAMLDKNRELGKSLDIRGTPALIVNDQLFPGAVPYEDLKKIVEAAHAGKKIDASQLTQ